jgi:hypothetical protein
MCGIAVMPDDLRFVYDCEVMIQVLINLIEDDSTLISAPVAPASVWPW